ncbi:hypothetical protein SAMN05421766_10330 [Zobellia uliginosa]|uniref:DUF4488 domain-containing protein n=1 Tax=Zobellia uliginosa TaxID=143224 RepID=A0ABY1KPW7_9FLAO|nr:hypothetical protein [Zobellia uliginosa]SIS63237.1 hypothetical protein SAMN05421766_10330 [Zobellia uliginosa]
MKQLIGLALMMLLLISATKNPNNVPELHPTIEGTWELVSRYNYDGENVTDTLTPEKGYHQIKMFYNGKIMWTRYTPNKTVEWFGYGSYEATDNSLVEKLEYMSASMRKIANPDMVWRMELQLKNNTYTQISLDEDGGRIASENYRRID